MALASLGAFFTASRTRFIQAVLFLALTRWMLSMVFSMLCVMADDPTEAHLDRKVDILRRALVEHPPVLGSEAQMLAYFRGFVAGAQRSEHESERFERLKDLCHRIAAERSLIGRRGHADYEDNLSAAYEGLLVFLRGRRPFDDVPQERKIAALAIRNAVIDQLRSSGDFNRSGGRRHTEAVLSQYTDEAGKPAYDEPASQERPGADFDFLHDLGTLELPPRSQRILELLGAGYKLREVGEEVGLSEGRVCQIAKGVAKSHPELEKFLLERVA